MNIKNTPILKVFFLLTILLLSINMASASIDYIEENQTYIINSFFPPWLGGDGESIVRLVNNTEQCIIDCSFTLEFNNEEEVNLLEDIAYIYENGENVSQNIENIIFTIGKYQDVQKIRLTYGEVCENQSIFNNVTGLNETQNICLNQTVGNESYIINELVWSNYNGEEVSGLNYLKANAKKKVNKKVDWIITFRGEELVDWAWWDANWEYKREITVTEESGSSLTNYTTLIYVAYDSDMKTDFSDLRFVENTGTTELSYWIENKIDNNFAWIWVKIPSMTASSNTIIYMYYGNILASTTSDPNDVFWLYKQSDATTYTLSTNGIMQLIFNESISIYGEWEYQIAGVQSYRLGSDWSQYVGIGFDYTSTSDISSGQDMLNFGNQSCNADGTIWDRASPCRFGDPDGTINKTVYSKRDLTPIISSGDHYISFYQFLDTSGKTAQIKWNKFILKGYASSEPTYLIGSEQSSNGLIITQNSPINYYNSTSQNVFFDCNGTDETGLYSLNLTINGSVYETITGLGSTNLTISSSENLTDGSWEWYCTGNDDTETKNTSIRYLEIDSTLPVISMAFNLTDLTTFNLPINSTWHFNATDPTLESCYYNTSDNVIYKIITCNATENTTWDAQGLKTIQWCANDTFGFEICNSTTLDVYLISYNQSNTHETVAESFDVTFNLTVNMTGIPITTANLYVNNTIYYPTTTTAGTNGYYFERTITIPDMWGNISGITQYWYWNYTINGVISNENTTTENITVYELDIDDCSAYGDLILNFSLRNEETAILINESAGANVEVDLTLTSKNNASVYLTYSNTWTDENNPQVCLQNNVLNNSEYWLDLTVGFDSTDHVWEFYYIDNGTLNSAKILQSFNGDVTSNINLMDLLTEDSTSFLFNYFDQDGLAVVDAIVHPMRKYIGDGAFLEIERSKADQNGDTIVHLVEEDVIYLFHITQYGILLHTSSTYTALCQATPCTIQIEASGDGAIFDTDWDLIDGGAYTITSSANARTVNLTYFLNDSSIMNLTVYNYNYDGSYSIIDSTSETGSSGSMILTIPQSAGNVSFFATVHQDNSFVNSEWVDFEQKSGDYMSTTLALFLSALLILTLGLMAVTEGVGTLVMVILGVAVAGFLGLMRTELSTGVNVIIYLIVAGGILLWKLTGGRK